MPSDSAMVPDVLMADGSFATAARSFASDKRFEDAWKKLDVVGFCTGFNTFCDRVAVYNDFHRMERRLWSLKLGKGKVPEGLETGLRERVPLGRKAYADAFGGIDNCLGALEQAGFDELLDAHLGGFTALLKDQHHPLRAVLQSAFTRLGCSSSMLEEFDRSLSQVDYNPKRIVGTTRPSELRRVLKQSTEAQDKIFQFTQAHGLSYLKGECGPPAWAVTASEVLAYFGFSIGAWVIVAIVAVIITILVVLCATKLLPASILSKCKYLSVTLGFTF